MHRDGHIGTVMSTLRILRWENHEFEASWDTHNDFEASLGYIASSTTLSIKEKKRYQQNVQEK
jgi:hypothetical protein